MNNKMKICRICLSHDKNDQFTSIFEYGSDIATKIFLISGIKIVDLSDCVVPSSICLSCIKELSKVIRFRKKCLESEGRFKKFLINIEKTLWNEKLVSIKPSKRKRENIIKQELDDLDLFEVVDTTIDENCHTDALETIQNSTKIERSDDPNSEVENSDKKGRVKRKIKHESEDSDVEIVEDSLAHCNLCSKSFTSMHSMKDHMRAIHQKLEETDMFKCKYCDRLFKMKYYLNRHIRNAHKINPDKETKITRPKSKSNDEIFKEKLSGINCPYCNKFLTSRHSLSDHIRVRHEFIDFSDKFLCDICGKDFPIKYYLIRHVRAAHLKTLVYKKKKVESLPCSICGKILKSKGNLSTHEKTHKVLTPDEYWYCDLCGNKFKGRGEMSVHIKKRHLYNITYPCELCPGRSWRTLFQLQRHIKVIHHNIKEFKCEWCGKEFGEKNKLVCHTRIHTGEQPFGCTWENCGRKFTHQTDLRRHVWGHSGERPYKCEVPNCFKGFMKKSELLAHENRCHPPNQPQIRTAPLTIPYQYQMM